MVITSDKISCSLTQPAAFAGKLGIVSFHQEIFTSLKYVFFFLAEFILGILSFKLSLS